MPTALCAAPAVAPVSAISLRRDIDLAYCPDEAATLRPFLAGRVFSAPARSEIEACARSIAARARETPAAFGVEQFLAEYRLATEEGVVLMCLAEALLRIPDPATAQQLIRDLFRRADWDRHLGRSDAWWVNASTWGLLLTGKIVVPPASNSDGPLQLLGALSQRLGEGLVRKALEHAMRFMAEQFVLGPDMPLALRRAAAAPDWRYSFDMLGEAALTAANAESYLAAYQTAIESAGQAIAGAAADAEAPYSVSVKLSALHPRFDELQRERTLPSLCASLLQLAQAAQRHGVALTVDAEEAERLALSLEVFEAVFRAPALAGFSGLGLAVQAYQRRALPVLRWLAALAQETGKRIPLRLVKGAYWDSEIKRAQALGLASFPVFTRKAASDVSYLACAEFLLQRPQAFYPQFATHNAHTIAALLWLGAERQFEFQRLHGMGDSLYQAVRELSPRPCRVYAPVGAHDQLLPYLVRRLLENGANTSFVHRLADPQLSLESIVADPSQTLARHPVPNPKVVAPSDLFLPRRNSSGIAWGDRAAAAALRSQVLRHAERQFCAAPIVGGEVLAGTRHECYAPFDHRRVIGTRIEADTGAVARALELAHAAFPSWEARCANQRAAALERAADALEAQRAELMALLAIEAGKCVPDALSEVREAVDLCRYYAGLARRDFAVAKPLPGLAGEANSLSWRGRGVFACISPWNFPLAIFAGQIAAALAAGNCVIAKPAQQTPLIGARCIELFLQTGIPSGVLHYLPGPGATLGGALAADERVAGIAFTGSSATARAIQRHLAERDGAIVPFIAETGGQNCLIADSTAHVEQLVQDAITSAFNSAGQRCSALRVLFVQEDIAARVVRLLCDVTQALVLGNPLHPATDVGPIIDAAAAHALQAHLNEVRGTIEARAAPAVTSGTFFAPTVVCIDDLSALRGEVFGPVLHVVRFAAGTLDRVIDQIDGTGYGLTCGVHSRIEATQQRVLQRVRAGNCYVNRNMIGAVVESQPFGGEGLSGTGPKAGGPHYLARFATERCVSVNTAAIGGNAALFAQNEE
jgi:RHH-type proline utilization regulon transcriptional repressor/proline dehydrogenase/delta 1-pyrroline-5-carboxylate dehydrogenase